MSGATQRNLFVRTRTGSIYILVVAVLAILGLLTITVSFTAQMELHGSRNSVDSVQAIISAATNIPFELTAEAEGRPLVELGVRPGLEIGSIRVVMQPNLKTEGALLYRNGPTPRRESAGVTRASSALTSARSGRIRSARSAGVTRASSAMTSARSGRMRSAQRVSRRAGSRAESARSSQSLGDPADAVFGHSANVSIAFGRSWIEDESGKININTILPNRKRGSSTARDPSGPSSSSGFDELDLADPKTPDPAPYLTVDDLARFIAETLEAKGVASTVRAQDLAQAIADYRYGEDGQPGSAGKDDNANGGRADPRVDGIDNDQDRVIDNPEEETFGTAADGVDNDGDGVIDEAGESIADDGLDNDFDGEIDEKDEGVDEPDESSADIRLTPFGDDQPFGRLMDLMRIPGMTPQMFDALAPHLTVFSVSRPAFLESVGGIMGIPQLDPNTIRPEEVYDLLTDRMNWLPVELIGQYIANMVDRRDADSVPTELEFDGRTFYGIEITPYINEICPDVVSLDLKEGDDGQFIELINPYTDWIDVNGWTLEGAGPVITLSGAIPPEGLLVITDDYTETNDPTPEKKPGRGSLFDIFDVVAMGLERRVLEITDMNLDNEFATVNLFDREHNLVDSFSYKNGTFAGTHTSFQRLDPRLRYTRRRPATPLEPNIGAIDTTAADREGIKAVELLHNRPFRSPLELLLVSTSYVPENADQNDELALGWQFPSEGRSDHNLDVRVIDFFMPGAPIRRHTGLHQSLLAGRDGVEFSGSRRSVSRSRSNRETPSRRPRDLRQSELVREGMRRGMEEAASRSRIQNRMRELRDSPPPLFGRINVNTAAPAVLCALPGIDRELAYRISRLRLEWFEADRESRQDRQVDKADADAAARTVAWYEAFPPQSDPRWKGLEEFFVDDDLWGDASLSARIKTVFPFSRMITFHSLSFKVITESASNSSEENEDRRPSRMRSERIIAADRGRIETVIYHHRKAAHSGGVDQDLRFAQPASESTDLGLELIRAMLERK